MSAEIVTFKYALKGKRAKRKLRRFAWAVNQVWNFCVETQRSSRRRWKEGGASRWPSNFDLTRLTAGTSCELNIPAKTIQDVCRRFSKNRDQHRRCPRFRSSSGPRRSLGWVPFDARTRRLEGNTITYSGHMRNTKGRDIAAVFSIAVSVAAVLGVITWGICCSAVAQ